MAIANLQTRIDQLYELTFGQVEQKEGQAKPTSQATRRLRRTLGSNSMECSLDYIHIADTLRDQFKKQGITLDNKKNSLLIEFASDIISGFRADRRYNGGVGSTTEYKAGRARATVTIVEYSQGKKFVFILDGLSRNDSSFANANRTISQKLMDSDKYAPLFQEDEAGKTFHMAHEEGYGIVETKHRLIRGEIDAAGSEYSDAMSASDKRHNIDPSKLPPDPIRDALKKIQSIKSKLILSAEHNLYVKGGKVMGKTTFKGKIEARNKNQMDAVEQARLGQELKDVLTDLQKVINDAYAKTDPNAKKGTRAWDERNSRSVIDTIGDVIVMSPTKRKLYAKGRGVNKSKYNKIPKGKSPTKVSREGNLTKQRQKVTFAGPTGRNRAPIKSPEKGTGKGKENYAMQMRNLLKVKNAINKRLPAAVRRNMGRPSLINRTGRFSDSVQVDSIMPAAQTLMVKYNYRINPYETFENKGKTRWPTGYNPKPLISKSIRELAMGLVSQKLTIRRA